MIIRTSRRLFCLGLPIAEANNTCGVRLKTRRAKRGYTGLSAIPTLRMAHIPHDVWFSQRGLGPASWVWAVDVKGKIYLIDQGISCLKVSAPAGREPDQTNKFRFRV